MKPEGLFKSQAVFKKTMLLIMLISILTGCGKEQLRPASYVRYITHEQNGLIRKLQAEAYALELHYLPLDLQVLNECGQETVSKKAYEQLKAEYEGQIYFKLKIKTITGSIEAQLKKDQALQNFLHFNGSRQIQLRCGKKTYPVSLYHTERGMQPSPYITLLFSFELSENAVGNDLLVSIDAPACFGQKLEWCYSKESIQNLPQLKTN